MTIELNESIRGIWFCTLVPDEQDFLLSLARIAEKHSKITYRFRYYNSSDPFDEDDEKNWYSGEVTGQNEAEAITTIHDTFMPIISAINGNAEFTGIIRGDRSLDEFIAKFMEQDFVHTKSVSKEQYDACTLERT